MKLKELIIEAGEKLERQERGIIDAINAAVSKAKIINVIAGKTKIENVVGAKKMDISNKLGKEPLTDVIIQTTARHYNVSAKGPSAPSMAGGGMAGIAALTPELIKNFLINAEQVLSRKFKKGEMNVPDVYGEISKEDAAVLLTGNEAVGGPIDYMYIGPMDVDAKLNGKDLVLNGQLISVNEYANTHKIYLRSRKRREDQPFEPGTKDSAGLPAIFGKSPTKGDVNRRIVTSVTPPAGALIVKI